ncbi:hypothetical protein BJ165DRAFT_1400659 [Panaeolus papilionaceus]|nr:hypothetical protein BJ165DRAFT_1400659 [Panaeolus papilionaceus]
MIEAAEAKLREKDSVGIKQIIMGRRAIQRYCTQYQSDSALEYRKKREELRRTSGLEGIDDRHDPKPSPKRCKTRVERSKQQKIEFEPVSRHKGKKKEEQHDTSSQAGVIPVIDDHVPTLALQSPTPSESEQLFSLVHPAYIQSNPIQFKFKFQQSKQQLNKFKKQRSTISNQLGKVLEQFFNSLGSSPHPSTTRDEVDEGAGRDDEQGDEMGICTKRRERGHSYGMHRNNRHERRQRVERREQVA